VEARAAEPCDTQQRLRVLARLRLGGERLIDGTADDEPEDIRLGDVARAGGAPRLAVAQDRDPVGDAAHFRQAV